MVSLVWFGIFPNASLLHVSLVGTRGRDVPLREIANHSTSPETITQFQVNASLHEI